MLQRIYTAILLGLLFAGASSVDAQPLKGMVWDPPANIVIAAADLENMRAAGVEAVRTTLLNNESLYTLADSLGLVLYQDFPFNYLSAQALQDTLRYARQILREAARWTARHPSARYFGLARHSDTSVAAACGFMRELMRQARTLFPPSVKFYYITSFVEDDRCSGEVDFVMIDVLDSRAPVEIVPRWQKIHPKTPLSISALGTWVDVVDDVEDGYKRKYSLSYQARYLETNLLEALDGANAGNLDAVFVFRWRDLRLEFPSPAHNLSYPNRQTYGILTFREVQRPSFQVVKGIYTDTQRVFAFPVGEAPPAGIPWVTLLVWLNVAVIAFGLSHFPRLRPTMMRYFTAHGFFREAVSEGRELLFGPNVLLLFVLMLSFSATLTVVLETVRMSEAFTVLVRWMPQAIRDTTILLLGRPLVLMVLLSSAFALAIVIWTSLLSAASARSRRLLLPAQVFTLVIWSQWVLLPMLAGAVVISTLDSPLVARYALALFVLLVAGIVWASARTIRDYVSIIRANPLQFGIAILGNPFVAALLVGLYLCYLHSAKFAFFWHLIVRS